ncbi:hypothetical protein DPMN_082944 [Dreissena polymorpha]|uniref:Uncharacterized protein n=1 Tax=Dreissena polymorpha TaxID=45954 RepID=A0A9D4BHY3_DREPO|nr:hypothetical protein DPMN_082944 [Dreissena polymorpha]
MPFVYRPGYVQFSFCTCSSCMGGTGSTTRSTTAGTWRPAMPTPPWPHARVSPHYVAS